MIVLGLPGFLHASEPSRIDGMLVDLSMQYSIIGMRVNYSGVERERDGRIIRCRFKLDEYVQDIRKALQKACKIVKEGESQVGIIASSISAGIVGHYIAAYGVQDSVLRTSICACLSISPVTGWPEVKEKRLKDVLERGEGDFPLTSCHDARQGITRFIPKEYVPELRRLNSLVALATSPPQIKSVTTLVGKNDEMTQLSAMKTYHTRMGGTERTCIEYPTGHDIPAEECYKQAMNVFKPYAMKLLS